MAKKATSTSKSSTRGKSRSQSKASGSRAVATTRSSDNRRQDEGSNAGEAFIKLLQSPLVAELLTVAATAALAALAEQGFSCSGGPGDKRRTGRAVKAAGKAAAAAIGRRLATEIDEVRNASRKAKESGVA